MKNTDLGHYSTINMNFNTGSWTRMDDYTVRCISSFTLMNEIRNFVDKVNISSMVYCRENVCAVTYIIKIFMLSNKGKSYGYIIKKICHI